MLNNTIRLKLVFTLGRFLAQKRPHYTCLGHTPQIWSFVYKHKLTGQILGWVFNSRRCQLYVMHLPCSNVQHGLRVVNLAQTTFVRYLTTRIISINVLGCHGKEGLVKTCANLRQNFPHRLRQCRRAFTIRLHCQKHKLFKLSFCCYDQGANASIVSHGAAYVL